MRRVSALVLAGLLAVALIGPVLGADAGAEGIDSHELSQVRACFAWACGERVVDSRPSATPGGDGQGAREDPRGD